MNRLNLKHLLRLNQRKKDGSNKDPFSSKITLKICSRDFKDYQNSYFSFCFLGTMNIENASFSIQTY